MHARVYQFVSRHLLAVSALAAMGGVFCNVLAMKAAAHPPRGAALKTELAQAGVARFTSSEYKPGVVRHVVLFRFRAGVSEARRQEVRERFIALKDTALRGGKPYIVSIDGGAQISGEDAGPALEQGFIVTFGSQGDRNFYVGQPVVTDPAAYDPAHQRFKDFVRPLLDDGGVVVFDFQAGPSS